MGWWRGLVVVCLLASACAGARPQQPHNICSVFRQRNDWYAAARDSYRRWGVPVSTQLAVIHRESSFRANARPPRRWYLGFIPGGRPSTAYGYGQVLDATWERYRIATDNRWADRDDFADVTDFIGWYGDVGQKRYGISKRDAATFYASYHVGHAGFRRGLHRTNATASRAVRDVRNRASLYAEQYRLCQAELDAAVDESWWWPF
ncbi:MAG: hypothetical protein ABGY42_17760 [bacterium]